jgi:hypothetical protein
MLKITEHMLETKKEDFDPLEARYRMILIEKLRDKQADAGREPGVRSVSGERHQPDG